MVSNRLKENICKSYIWQKNLYPEYIINSQNLERKQTICFLKIIDKWTHTSPRGYKNAKLSYKKLFNIIDH